MPRAVNDNQREERRARGRHRVLMSGKVAWLEKLWSGDCAIRDLSDTGARIRLADPLAPNDPILIVLRSGVAHTARTAWRRGPDLGLEFLDSVDLTGPVPDRLAPLRRLWAAQLPR
jgi:hypothetical protein